MEHCEYQNDLWGRLVTGRPVDTLAYPSKDGRIDLSNWTYRSKSVKSSLPLPVHPGVSLIDSVTVESKRWRGIDFSGSDLSHLRFINCQLEDCIFDACVCEDWRLWKTRVEYCRFRKAKLRESMLGPVLDGIRNEFVNVDFSYSDLRRTGYFAAEFNGCIFNDAKLHKIDFRQSAFIDCTFRGELNEIVFNRFGADDKNLPTNEMTRVDMSKTSLRCVEFRNLDLNSVLFPQDDEHLILKNYPDALDRIIQDLRAKSTLTSDALADFFGVFRKWAGKQGVINKKDVLELASEDLWTVVLEAIKK